MEASAAIKFSRHKGSTQTLLCNDSVRTRQSILLWALQARKAFSLDRFEYEFDKNQLHTLLATITPEEPQMLLERSESIRLKPTRAWNRAIRRSNLSAESMPKASAMGVEAESLPPGTCHLPLATMR